MTAFVKTPFTAEQLVAHTAFVAKVGKTELRQFLLRKCGDWQTANVKPGKRNPTQKEYALSIGFNPATFSSYVGGRRIPTDKDLEKFSKIKEIGQEIYDAAGKERPPDRYLKFVKENWGFLVDAEKEEITGIVRRAIARRDARDSGKGLEISKREREAAD